MVLTVSDVGLSYIARASAPYPGPLLPGYALIRLYFDLVCPALFIALRDALT